MKKGDRARFETVDQYLARLPQNVRPAVEELRRIIRKAAPSSEEVISYNMPAVRQGGILVYYAAFKEHIGLYPTASPIRVFKKELARYKTSKGAIQFPMGKRIPGALVQKIVKFRIREAEGRKKHPKVRAKT